MNKVMIVDGHNLAYRIFYGTRARDPYDIAVKFIENIQMVIGEYQATHMTLCFDAYSNLSTQRPTLTPWRKKLYPGYKEGRSPMPAELDSALYVINQSLKASNVSYYVAQEADDGIGSLARWVRENQSNTEIVIYSNDADMHQLIEPLTSILYRDPQKAKYLVHHEGNYLANFGYTPEQSLYLKALVGDPSDNIKGVSGIGHKTALKLLKQCGSIDGIYDNLDDLVGIGKAKIDALVYYGDEIADILKVVTINTRLKYDIDFSTWAVEAHDLQLPYDTNGGRIELAPIATQPEMFSVEADQPVSNYKGD